VQNTKEIKLDSITNEEDALLFMMDEKFSTADIFSVFSRMMDLGIKELFGTTSDVSSLKEALKTESDSSALFKFESEKQLADAERRQKIEEIFEAERKKSAVLKRCNRMYH
jgi:hypothetical protein